MFVLYAQLDRPWTGKMGSYGEVTGNFVTVI